jgi:hypothetical protein
LYAWASDRKNYPYHDLAEKALESIIDAHDSTLMFVDLKVPWKEGVDPNRFTMQNLRDIFHTSDKYFRRPLVGYIWGRRDIPARERVDFLIDAIRHDDSLMVVKYASYYLRTVGHNIKSLAVPFILAWWENNKDKIDYEKLR